MKHVIALLFLIVIAPKISFSQQVKKPAPIKYMFNPDADAKKELHEAIERAHISHKNILVLVGGDWSTWSMTAYIDFVHKLQCEKNVEFSVINFSVANKNVALLDELDCPRNLGYPVFMILDENGKKLLAEDSDKYKADKKKYDLIKLSSFLSHWTTFSPNK